MKFRSVTAAPLVAIFALTGVGVMVSTSCGTATAEDRKKLQELRSVYGDRYEFELEEGLYVRAKRVLDKQPNKDEAIQIYKSFWFDGEKPRTTTYVYLNLFNERGDFQLQVYWDSKKNDFGFSQRPYY